MVWLNQLMMGAEMRVDEIALADEGTAKLCLVGTVDQQFVYQLVDDFWGWDNQR